MKLLYAAQDIDREKDSMVKMHEQDTKINDSLINRDIANQNRTILERL